MKTTIQFFKLKKPLRCGNVLLHFLYVLWQFCPQGASYFLVKIQQKSYAWMAVLQTCLDGLVAVTMERSRTHLLLSVKEALSNKRLMVGLMVGMVAFPMWKCHLFFDIDQEIAGFYYVNWAFYFNTIRAYICGIFLAIGFFIAAPQKWGFKWWALPLAIFCATEIYEQSLYDHWTDFYNPMPAWQQMTLIIVSMVPLFFSIDYLVYRKYHLKDGNIARIKGVIRMPNTDIKVKYELLEKLIAESENYNARV